MEGVQVPVHWCLCPLMWCVCGRGGGSRGAACTVGWRGVRFCTRAVAVRVWRFRCGGAFAQATCASLHQRRRKGFHFLKGRRRISGRGACAHPVAASAAGARVRTL
eukprot:358267-Chlamydomonas_euryale.AAC.1